MYLFLIKSIRKMKFKIHNEGWVFFISLSIITILTFPFFPIIGLFTLILTLFVYYFFRDPIRFVPVEELILSPADGKITFIGKSTSPFKELSKEEFIKISIFLSIFDVHVNRMPLNGIIKDIKYLPGKFINASLDKSSELNEKNIILIQNEKKEDFILTQIAGLIARRIICDINKDQKVSQGDKIGIIKFGSRVDLYVPMKYGTLVSVGQRVIAGETIISNPNNIENISNSKKK